MFFTFLDEAFENVEVCSIKQLKSKSATLSASNLEDHETLAGHDGSQTAIIIYTSGSTGTPKGKKNQ